MFCRVHHAFSCTPSPIQSLRHWDEQYPIVVLVRDDCGAVDIVHRGRILRLAADSEGRLSAQCLRVDYGDAVACAGRVYREQSSRLVVEPDRERIDAHANRLRASRIWIKRINGVQLRRGHIEQRR